MNVCVCVFFFSFALQFHQLWLKQLGEKCIDQFLERVFVYEIVLPPAGCSTGQRSLTVKHIRKCNIFLCTNLQHKEGQSGSLEVFIKGDWSVRARRLRGTV